MANKNEKKAAAAAAETKAPVANTEITSENIEEQIKSENKMEDTIVAAAEAELQKEKDDKKKSELKQAIVMVDYINKRELLGLRKRRDEEKATKAALTATKEVLDDIKAGKITPREADKKLAEIAENKRKEFNAIDGKNRDLLRELQNNYPSYYSTEWEYDRWAAGCTRRSWNW